MSTHPFDCDYHCPPMPCLRSHKPTEERKKVAIAGSQYLILEHWKWFYKMMDRATFALIDPIILVFGAMKGYGPPDQIVGQFAMNYAANNWYTMWIYYPNQSKYKPTDMARKRDEELMSNADYLVAFWNGIDRHTENTIELAKELKVKTKVFRF